MRKSVASSLNTELPAVSPGTRRLAEEHLRGRLRELKPGVTSSELETLHDLSRGITR